MLILSYVLFILLGVGFTFLFKLITKKFNNKGLKVISLVLALIYACRIGLGREAIHTVQAINMYSPFNNDFITFITIILIWFTYGVTLMFILHPFFKINNTKVFLKYFAPIILFLDLAFFKEFTIGIVGSNAFSSFSVRWLLLIFEFSICIGYFVSQFVNKDYLKTNKKEIKTLLLSLIPIMLAVIPVWVPKALIGYLSPNLEMKDLNEEHRISMYIALIIPMLIYYGLKNKDKETKRFALLFLALGTMFSYTYNFKFDIILEPTRWPLHLCNTAMFVVPFCLMFKLDKLFYFTVFINVFGAFIALMMPNYEIVNVMATNTTIFLLNHYMAFFMPLLIVMLGLYDRPNFKLFGYSMAAFAVYFVIIIFINAYFSNFGEVDFFFLNGDFVVNKLGTWAEKTRNITWTIHLGSKIKLVLYPLYQGLFFIGYTLLALGMWFIYEQIFAFQDYGKELAIHREKRKMEKLILKEHLNGRSIEEPMNEEGKNCFELKNFSKKYGLSKRYAVKDVSLKVNGGEIFGFLGPNGAGKSTIIKSLVGIQSITSGTMEVCGYDVAKQPVQAKKQIGFVPDHYALYENLTGREYINYIADLYEVSKEDRDQRIEKYLNIFQLKEAFDNQMKTYSHGMKQKMTIMAALIHEPKVWILDEPLTGLDPTSIYQVKECMKEHASKGNIVFFSSHIIDVVEKLCTRIAIIKKGTLLCDEKISDLKKKKIDLEKFYLEKIGD